MNTKLQSRTWSCSELVSGAAQIIDTMPAPSLDTMVVDEKHKLLGETYDLSAAEIEKLLQDMAIDPSLIFNPVILGQNLNHLRFICFQTP